MKEKIYIESSVVSYYTSNPNRDLIIAGRQQITCEKWPKLIQLFDPCISVLVLEEIKQGDPDAAQKRLAAVQRFTVLAITDRAEQLAYELLKDTIPPSNPDDALHIAIAASNGVDFLITWNFTHINNAQLKLKIVEIVEKYGYNCPAICSPEELLGE